MLQQMRKYTSSWVATLILGVPLVISFVVWGIADIFRGSTDTSVATVGGNKIPMEIYQREYRNATREATLKGALKPAEAHAYGQRALDALIGRAAVDIYAQRYGLTVSDDWVSARIRAVPLFAGPLGDFDHRKFLEFAYQLGFTEDQFIQAMREDATRNQLLGAASTGLQPSPGYAQAFFDFVNELRSVQYMDVPESAAGDVPLPGDAVLAAYVKQHGARFSTPEYRDVTFAWLTLQDVMSEVHASDDQLKQQYELQKPTYVIAEKREVEQLVFPNDAAAKAARAKIDSGTSFADLAKQEGKSQADISLGSVVEADLADRGHAAFALPQGGVSQPLKAPVGYSLIHVVSITPGSTKTFDQVKDELRKQIETQLAGAKLGDIGNQYIDESSRGEPLSQAAKKVGMHVSHVPAVDAHGLTPDGTKAQLPDDPEFLAQVFKAEVGEEGDPFQTKAGTSYVVKVEGVRPPKVKPLDAVREEAAAAWKKEQLAQRLAAKAKELAATAAEQKTLANIASGLGAKVETSQALHRPLPGEPPAGALPPALVRQIFSAPPGDVVYGPSAKGGYLVARVTGVLHPPRLPPTDSRLRRFAAQLGQQFAGDMQYSIAEAAKAHEGVTVNRPMVDRVTGGEGS